MKKRILIFDDDQEILLVCKIILEKQDYQVETRSSCDNIVEDIREVKPELILIDLRIPEMGGENAIKFIKSTDDISAIPVILFSANYQVEEICKRSNAAGYLQKPFGIATLLSTIKNNISKES